MYLSAKQKEEEQRAILERQRHLEEVLRQAEEMKAKARADSISDQEMVDSIFDFLPIIVGGQEGQAPAGFEVRQLKVLHVLRNPIESVTIFFYLLSEF